MKNRIMPFYMTYPLPLFYEEEDTVMRDLEYLQEMYPKEARKYQGKIIRLLDRFDYAGSVIYDEYPDRLVIFKMAQDMMAVIEQEEKEAGAEILPDKRDGILELVQVLLFYEVYKRRQAKGDGFLKL